MTGRERRGFGLVELIIATMLVSIISAAVYGLMTLTFRSQAGGLRRGAIHLSATLGLARLRADLASAQRIVQPPINGESDVLEGYIGRLYAGASATDPWVNPATGDATGSYTRFYYCRDGSGQWLYFRDSYPIAADPAALSCGAGAGWELLVSNPRTVRGLTPGGDRMFSRLGGARENLVEAWFAVNDPTLTPTQTFEVRVSLSSPFSARGSL